MTDCVKVSDPTTDRDARTDGAAASEKTTTHRAVVIADLGCGGSQRVVVSLSQTWRARGYAVTVITLANCDTDAHSLGLGIRRVALDCAGGTGKYRPIWSNMRRVLRIRRAIRESEAQEVAAFISATNVLTLVACMGLGVRVVVSERNDPRRQDIGRAWAILRRIFYRRAHRVSANSHGALTAMRAYVPTSKLVFVPNPLPVWSAPIPPWTDRERLMLAVGRLHSQKGFDLLLRILAASSARRMGWRLVIVGEGPERAALERLADRDVADIVSFVGQQQDIGQWYDRARLFVMTSRHEGMPNAFIEALSRGLPTIVSRTCGDAPNYVETLRCGTIIDAEDTLASARVLDRLLSDEPLLKTMSHRAAGDLESSFGREAVIRAWESAFSTRPL